MTNEKTVRIINKIILNHSWFDFEIINYDGYNLSLGGSSKSLLEPMMKYDLRIKFSDIFFISSLSNWSSDITQSPFSIVTGDEARKLNLKYHVEKGYSLFKINAEDYSQPLLIIAMTVSLE